MTREQVADHIRRTLNATTYVALAKKIQVTPPYLCMVFKGIRVPRPPILLRLSKALGVEMGELYHYISGLRAARVEKDNTNKGA